MCMNKRVFSLFSVIFLALVFMFVVTTSEAKASDEPFVSIENVEIIPYSNEFRESIFPDELEGEENESLDEKVYDLLYECEHNYHYLDTLRVTISTNVQFDDTRSLYLELMNKGGNEEGSYEIDPSMVVDGKVTVEIFVAELLSEDKFEEDGYGFLTGAKFFRAVIYTNDYDWDGYYVAVSDSVAKKLSTQKIDGYKHFVLSPYDCSIDDHVCSEWVLIYEPTVFKKGLYTKSCFACDKTFKKTPSKLTPTIKLSYKSKTLQKGGKFTLKVSKIANGDGIKKVSNSNKNAIGITRSGNKIKVTAKKPGTSTITVKLKSGKTAKCKVKVTNATFKWELQDLDYNTRYNYFELDLINRSNYTVTIYADGAELIDWDYQSFDRSVKSVNKKSSITIKPGKYKAVKFYLYGSPTWPGVDDKTIKFKAKIDGKTKWYKESINYY